MTANNFVNTIFQGANVNLSTHAKSHWFVIHRAIRLHAIQKPKSLGGKMNKVFCIVTQMYIDSEDCLKCPKCQKNYTLRVENDLKGKEVNKKLVDDSTGEIL